MMLPGLNFYFVLFGASEWVFVYFEEEAWLICLDHLVSL